MTNPLFHFLLFFYLGTHTSKDIGLCVGWDAVSASLSGSSSVELFHPSESLGSYVDGNHTCLVILVHRLGQDVNHVVVMAAHNRVTNAEPCQDRLFLRVLVVWLIRQQAGMCRVVHHDLGSFQVAACHFTHGSFILQVSACQSPETTVVRTPGLYMAKYLMAPTPPMMSRTVGPLALRSEW